MTKTEFVLSVLQTRGSISKLEGPHYDIGDVGREVRRLRDAGYKIETTTRKDVRGVKYTRYKLTEKGTQRRVGRPKLAKRLADDPEYERLNAERKKYRLQVSRTKTDEQRKKAEKRMQATVDAIEALKRKQPRAFAKAFEL